MIRHFRRMTVLLVSVAASQALFAGRAPFIDYGNVIQAEPIMKTIEVMVPVEECIPVATQILFPAPNRLRYYVGPAIVEEKGTVVTTVTEINTPVGSLVEAAQNGTREVAGLVKGLVIQEDIYPEPPVVVPVPPPVEVQNQVVCSTVEKPQKQKVFDGYKVTYVYNGQTFVIRTAERPGRQVKILVTTNATPIVQ